MITYWNSRINDSVGLVSYSAFPDVTMETISQIQCVPANVPIVCVPPTNSKFMITHQNRMLVESYYDVSKILDFCKTCSCSGTYQWIDNSIPCTMALQILWLSWPSQTTRQQRVLPEPPRGKTNNVVFEQVRHKPSCTSTERR